MQTKGVRPAVPSGRAPAATDSRAGFALDVEYYLSQNPRQLPSRYLYNPLGSSLFEAICLLPWYPVTRAEMRLLEVHRGEIMSMGTPMTRIVELGCGNGEKLALLADARRNRGGSLDLHLIDVSPAALAVSMRALTGLEGVRVVAHEGSYETGLAEVRGRLEASGRTLVMLLGSNIGNFDPPGAHEFLREIRAAVRVGDGLLLGADLVKPAAALQLAYDDPLGVTAAFNLNLLVRINRELGGDFDLASFAHRSTWNSAQSRVEMHLVSQRLQTVRIDAAHLEITFAEGESIWTESSYKFSPVEITALGEGAEFAQIDQWIDEEHPFALTLFQAV